MYVCVCNAIRDNTLKSLGRQGVRCAREAYSSLGHEPRCGGCLDDAHRILEEAGPQNSNRELAEDVA